RRAGQRGAPAATSGGGVGDGLGDGLVDGLEDGLEDAPGVDGGDCVTERAGVELGDVDGDCDGDEVSEGLDDCEGDGADRDADFATLAGPHLGAHDDITKRSADTMTARYHIPLSPPERTNRRTQFKSARRAQSSEIASRSFSKKP